jgi:F0F1-type ATP synthase delta subunit
MDSITLILCSKLRTVSNREFAIHLIDAVLGGNLHSKQGAMEKLSSYLAGIGVTDLDSSDTSLQNIKQSLLSVEVVKITMPYIPKTELIDRLHVAVSPLGVPILLEVNVDEGLRGGFVVYKAGKVIDMSFKTRVERLFKEEAFKEKVQQILQ